MNSSVVIPIGNDGAAKTGAPESPERRNCGLRSCLAARIASPFIEANFGADEKRKLVHCIKVGIALVSVSLLYILNPLYDRVGENGMWAIMTVIVIFEFHAGFTLILKSV